MRLHVSSASACALCLLLAGIAPAPAAAVETNALPEWRDIPSIQMHGGLKAFWNVGGKDRDLNERAAVEHGFEQVALLNTYSDYPGRQKEKIVPDGVNPWNKPAFFERIVRRNIDATHGQPIFVHDIEFHFEDNLDALWTNAALRTASRAATPQAFRDDYYREWASWFALPCRWEKEKYPNTPVGIYGPQPFRRDYWGVAGKDAQQIDGTHRTDAELWQQIAPAVDFCIASVYCFYDDPGSVFYMGANVEENVQRMTRYGNKPTYAYLWLRYHDSNAKLKGQEVADYLAESMAVLPYFCGARGVALWGWEPKGQGPYYHNLPLFVRSLSRVAALSEKIARATPDNDEPVHVAWKAKRPLIRKLRVSDAEWLVLACNPWQPDTAETNVTVRCGATDISLAIRGRHTEIYRVAGSRAERVKMIPRTSSNQRIALQSSDADLKIVTVELSYYDGNYLFEICGTDLRGVTWGRLENVIKNYAIVHPGREYECLYKGMLTTRTTDKIVRIFQAAGIKLRHFWVGNNFGGNSTGPYGPNLTDRLETSQPSIENR